MEENYDSNKFLSYLLIRFTKFLDGVVSGISKVKHFCGKNLPTENFDCQLQLVLGNSQLASYRKMKYLESNLVCVNVVSLPVGKQNDIGYEMYERV